MDENRHRHTVWMDDAVWDQVESHYQRDNCSTKTNLSKRPSGSTPATWTRNLPTPICPEVLADVLEGKLGALGKRMGHLLFKLSVDQNLMGNILAADIEIDPMSCEKPGCGVSKR